MYKYDLHLLVSHKANVCDSIVILLVILLDWFPLLYVHHHLYLQPPYHEDINNSPPLQRSNHPCSSTTTSCPWTSVTLYIPSRRALCILLIGTFLSIWSPWTSFLYIPPPCGTLSTYNTPSAILSHPLYTNLCQEIIFQILCLPLHCSSHWEVREKPGSMLWGIHLGSKKCIAMVIGWVSLHLILCLCIEVCAILCCCNWKDMKILHICSIWCFYPEFLNFPPKQIVYFQKCLSPWGRWNNEMSPLCAKEWTCRCTLNLHWQQCQVQ